MEGGNQPPGSTGAPPMSVCHSPPYAMLGPGRVLSPGTSMATHSIMNTSPLGQHPHPMMPIDQDLSASALGSPDGASANWHASLNTLGHASAIDGARRQQYENYESVFQQCQQAAIQQTQEFMKQIQNGGCMPGNGLADPYSLIASALLLQQQHSPDFPLAASQFLATGPVLNLRPLQDQDLIQDSALASTPSSAIQGRHEGSAESTADTKRKLPPSLTGSPSSTKKRKRTSDPKATHRSPKMPKIVHRISSSEEKGEPAGLGMCDEDVEYSSEGKKSLGYFGQQDQAAQDSSLSEKDEFEQDIECSAHNVEGGGPKNKKPWKKPTGNPWSEQPDGSQNIKHCFKSRAQFAGKRVFSKTNANSKDGSVRLFLKRFFVDAVLDHGVDDLFNNSCIISKIQSTPEDKKGSATAKQKPGKQKPAAAPKKKQHAEIDPWGKPCLSKASVREEGGKFILRVKGSVIRDAMQVDIESFPEELDFAGKGRQGVGLDVRQGDTYVTYTGAVTEKYGYAFGGRVWTPGFRSTFDGPSYVEATLHAQRKEAAKVAKQECITQNQLASSSHENSVNETETLHCQVEGSARLTETNHRDNCKKDEEDEDGSLSKFKHFFKVHEGTLGPIFELSMEHDLNTIRASSVDRLWEIYLGRFPNDEWVAFMNKQYRKDLALGYGITLVREQVDSLPLRDHALNGFLTPYEPPAKIICENCAKTHDGSFGNGKFCCRECSRGASKKKSRQSSTCKSCGIEHDGLFGTGLYCSRECSRGSRKKPRCSEESSDQDSDSDEGEDSDSDIEPEAGSIIVQGRPAVRNRGLFVMLHRAAIEEWTGMDVVAGGEWTYQPEVEGLIRQSELMTCTNSESKVAPKSTQNKTSSQKSTSPTSESACQANNGGQSSSGLSNGEHAALWRPVKLVWVSSRAPQQSCSVEDIAPGLDLSSAPDVNATGSARTEGFMPAAFPSKLPFLKLQTEKINPAFKNPSIYSKLPENRRYILMQENLLNRIAVGRSPIHGLGLFAISRLIHGQMIVEYTGEQVRFKVADTRELRYGREGLESTYFFRVDNNWIVDATKMHNQAHYINHSCDPNCCAKIVVAEGCQRIVIFAKRDILIGEELTYDYKLPIEDEKITCYCGAANCRKVMN